MKESLGAPLRLGAFGAALAVAFAAALGAGGLVGPVLGDDGGQGAAGHGGAASGEGAHGGHGGGASAPGGLQVSQGGYTLEPVAAPEEAGQEGELSFRITGPGGDPVTDFAVEHEKEMHLIVVGRDLGGYQHLHPELGSDGVWTAETAFDTPGPYRMFADFAPAGADEGLVLGTDLAVPGDWEPAALPEAAPTAETGDYTVRLDGGLDDGPLRFTVEKDGREVDALEPYLGAQGHLVAVREGDLAYLHVHPRDAEEGTSGAEVAFDAEAPSPGRYRLFLDFQHGGEVRTAEFTAEVGGVAGASGSGGGSGSGSEEGGGHGESGHGH